MKKIFLFLMLLSQAAAAQFSKVEYEMGRVSPDKVIAWRKRLDSTGHYLKPVDVVTRLEATLQAKVKIAKLKPFTTAPEGPDLYDRVKASTLVLISANIRATAYVVDASGICITNYHVMNMFFDSTGRKEPLFAMTADGRFFPVLDIIACSKVNDIAVIRLDTDGATLPALPMGAPAREGSDVFVMGHPNHIMYYFSKGIVAKNFIRAVPLVDEEEDYRMAITADYSLGESGGPVVDNKGNVVGMVSSAVMLYGDPQKRQNPQMVVKSAIPLVALMKLVGM